MTGEPPLLPGAVNVTDAVPLPGVAAPMVGAPGRVTGVTLLDDPEAAPVPTPLVAVTVNVYGVPFASPLTTMGLEEPELVKLPGLEVTV